MVDNLDKAESKSAAGAAEPIKVSVDAQAVVRKAVEQSKLDVGNGD